MRILAGILKIKANKKRKRELDPSDNLNPSFESCWGGRKMSLPVAELNSCSLEAFDDEVSC